MDYALLARIDRTVGRPLCMLLSLHARLANAVRRTDDHRATAPPRRICFIKLIEQGTSVLAYDAMRRALEMVGRDNVFVLVFDENRPILDEMGVLPRDQILSIRTSRLGLFCRDLLRSLAELRRLRIDAVIDMELFARGSAVLAYLSGAERRVGSHRFTSEGPYRGTLMTHRVAWNPTLHMSQTFSLLVEVLRRDVRDLARIPTPELGAQPPAFAPNADDLTRVRALLEQDGLDLDNRQLVLLNPNLEANLLPLRTWPERRWVELGRRLLAESPDVRVVVVGTRAEQQSAQRVASAIDARRARSIAGATTMRDLLSLFTVSRVLVTADSGPAHFAMLTPIQTIVLFGPETPALYAPLGPRVTVMTSDLACSPCFNAINHRVSPCDNNLCMQAIEVAQVEHAVNQALQTGRTRQSQPSRG